MTVYPASRSTSVTVIIDLAAVDEIPEAVPVLDPFHVVRLGAEALDQCRRRVQSRLDGHRGHKNDSLCRASQTLHTGEDLLTDR